MASLQQPLGGRSAHTCGLQARSIAALDKHLKRAHGGAPQRRREPRAGGAWWEGEWQEGVRRRGARRACRAYAAQGKRQPRVQSWVCQGGDTQAQSNGAHLRRGADHAATRSAADVFLPPAPAPPLLPSLLTSPLLRRHVCVGSAWMVVLRVSSRLLSVSGLVCMPMSAQPGQTEGPAQACAGTSNRNSDNAKSYIAGSFRNASGASLLLFICQLVAWCGKI